MLEASAKIVLIGGNPGERGRLMEILRAAKLHIVGDRPLSRGSNMSVAAIQLTPRETEVLVRLAKGHSYRAIASELEVRLSTVQTYVKSTYRKLGVSNRSEATALAIRMGLVDRND